MYSEFIRKIYKQIVLLGLILLSFNTQASALSFTLSAQTSTYGVYNVSCYQGNNGFIDLQVIGGVAPFVYNWSNGETTEDINNLTAGTYKVIVKDASLYMDSIEVTLIEPNQITITPININNVSCYNGSDAAIDLDVLGGNPTYQYQWSSGEITQDLTGLSVGTYTITVTDNFSCTVSSTFNITEPAPISLSLPASNEFCGLANGSVTAIASGGVGTLSYLWSNGSTLVGITSLTAGVYTATITDQNLCSATGSVTLINFSAPVINIDSTKIVSCFGGNDGGVFVSVTGGTLPISYLWSNGSTNQDLVNVMSGTYTLTVTDGVNCTAQTTVIVNQLAQLQIVFSVNNDDCNNGNGSIVADVFGGVSPYSFLWSNGATTDSIFGLTSGTYTVTVNDQNCTETSTVTVNGSTPLVVSLLQLKNVTCNGSSNGDINIDATGNGPFIYTWSNGKTTQDNSSIGAGTYTVTVINSLGCINVSSYVVSQPTPIQLIPSSDSSTCSQNNGSASILASGGTGLLSYLWSTSAVTSAITNLTGGTYAVTVTDANGCTKDTSVKVAASLIPVIVTDSVYAVSCNGGSDGKVDISTSIGGPFNYLWSNGKTTQDITSLSASAYTVIVTNASGCSATTSANVNEPLVINASFTNTAEHCFSADGTSTINVSGGTIPYFYLWSNGATTSNVAGLSAGVYTCTVTDTKTCTATFLTNVLNVVGPSISSISKTDVSCFSGTDGAISIAVTGAGPISFLWSNGQTTQNLINLTSNTYTVTATDVNGCTITSNVLISQPNQLTFTINTTQAGCNLTNGTANVSVNGGQAPYQYLWSSGNTSSNVSGLAAGVYTVTVTDANNCTKTDVVTVNASIIPTVSNVVITNVSCNGGANGIVDIEVSGGSSFNYLWSNGVTAQDLNGVAAGIYTVTITNNDGCTFAAFYNVVQSSAIIISPSITNASCNQNNGSIALNVSGGIPAYNFLWNNGVTLNSISNVTAGTYTVTVTDSKSCTSQQIISISNLSGPSITNTQIIDVTCFGASNGSVAATVFGGTLPISYLWSNGATVLNINNLSTGNYTLTVTDANNCIAQVTVFVDQPAALSGNFNAAVDSCNEAKGALSFNVTGGTIPYGYLWTNGTTNSSIVNITSGTYTITVTDANSCTATFTSIVQASAIPSISLVNKQDVSCNGGTNGNIEITQSGGTSFTYLWSNSTTTQNLLNITAGLYTVTVTNNFGCTISATFTINQPALINLSLSSNPATCGNSNGSVTTNITGGIMPYTYQWSNGSTLDELSNINGGVYTVTVTDANLCTVTQSAIVLSFQSPVVTVNAFANVSCFGGNDGSINNSVAGGTAPFSFLWSDGVTSQSRIGLSAGTYTVTVSDINGCTGVAIQSLSQPAILSISLNSTSAICNLNNGLITSTVSGGTGSIYSYLWNIGATSANITGLAAGTYTITVTDLNGCTMTKSALIDNLSGPTVSIASIIDVACFGENNGSINITNQGGTLPLNFLWSNGATVQNISGLLPGIYTVTVTDANNCIATAAATVNEPDLISITETISNATCANSNGNIGLSVTGGVGLYSFVWSNGNTLGNLTNISAGTFSVTVSDANGCSVSETYIVNNLSGPTIASITPQHVTCFGAANGAISITTSGGTLPFSYIWNNGQTVANISSLSAGNYTLSITDANGCFTTVSQLVNQPSEIIINTNASASTCGQNNGSASASALGGTGTFTFLWSNGATTSSIAALASATYTVTVTDAVGCTKSALVSVNSFNGPVVSVQSISNVSCNGFNDGAIITNVIGGTSPLSFLWSNGTTNQSLQLVSAGTYTITVTDASNCVSTLNATIIEPDELIINGSVAAANCGNPLGTINTIITGGTQPYSYMWSNGSTSANLNGLSPGNYNLTVTDALGCNAFQSFQVNATPIPVISLINATNVLCNGKNDGSINLNIVGGVSFNYTWNDGAITKDRVSLFAGSYTITVTNNFGCSSSATYQITEPPVLSVSLNTVQPKCSQNNGSIVANAIGGVASYTYIWNTGSTNSSLNNLLPGIYTVTVSDINACTAMTSVTLIDVIGPAIIVDSVFKVTCFGYSDGSMFISITNGLPPYAYLWNNGSSIQDQIGLASGVYTVTVTDFNGCTAQLNQVITQPIQIQIVTGSSNATCGQSNGSVSATASGGTGTLSYLWNTGAVTSSVTNLPSGTYTVTVTDANGCTQSGLSNVSNANGPVISNVSAVNTSCFGGSNGSITVTVSGGTAPLTYQWSNGSSTQNISNVGSGTYTLTVTDANGCNASISQNVGQPIQIQIVTGSSNATCGQSNGSVSATASGGTGTLSYLWNTGAVTSSVTNLPSGTYTVTVTDANGCTQSGLSNVSNANGPVISNVSAVNTSCFGGSNGSITVTVSGGTAPLTYQWSNGSSTQNISNVGSGTYTLTVTDANGCNASISQNVGQPIQIQIVTGSSNATCGQSNGSVSATASGGTGTLSYLWNTGAVTSSVTNLPSGTYTVTVTDANGCTQSGLSNVSNANGPVISNVSAVNTSCFGGSNGSITVTVSGGTAPLTYQWSNGSSTQNISNVGSGTYTLTVTDANGCNASISQNVGQPIQIQIVTGSSNATCGQSNGSVSATASGGTGTLSYLWNTGAVTSSVTNLPSGTYTVTVTDANGCTQSGLSNVSNANGPVISNVSAVNTSCFGGSNGSITVTVSGGTAPLTYQWSNGSSTQNISNVGSGTYTLTVTDANGCNASISQNVGQPIQIQIVTGSSNATCGQSNGSVSATASGGTGTLSYLWNTGAVTSSVTNLPSGTYTVTVTDANGCTQSGLSNVSNANGPVISNVSAVNTSCFGGSNGSITVTVSGGTAPLTYQWSNGSSTQNISNVGSGTYTLTVTDANGCNASISQNVGQPIQIQIVTGSSNATCGQSNGSVSATASGGTGTLSYLWNTGAVTSSVTNLPSGTYTVTVTDANGCTQSGLSNVSNANGPVISNVSAVNTSCFGGSNGSITVTVSGGTAPLTYQWSNGSSTQNISNVGSGTYTLTVTDANGCNASISQNVGQPIQIQIVTGSSNATCGQSNGSVSATASGGTGTLSYLWNTGAVTSSVTNLPSGTYTVTVTDANGCTQSGLSNVSNANGPVISNVSAVNTSCFGGSNGSITVTVSGGTAPLTYQWSNGSSTQNISNVGSGTYTLTVTDANGCNASISQNVGQPIQIQIVTGSSNATCGQSNGSVSATASGGTGTLSYLWNTGAVTSSVTNLPSGTYTVTVTDANGCTQSGLSNVSNANGPVISNVSAVNTSCFGGSNGSITVTVSGGTAPLTYQWSNGSSTQNISNVGSGTYTLTVTDANGCNASISQNVGQPIQIQIVTGSSNATCGQSNGSVSATASGGTGTLSYLWNTGAVTSSVTNLPSGTYTVTVTDANGCTQSGLSNVSNANGPVISNVSAVNTSCFGGSNGSITVTVSGGTAPLTYQWSNGSSTQNISNVGSGTYTLTVTDANGCNASISQNVGQPIQIQIVTGSSNATCGQSNGSVSATASGGTGTLSYLWNTGAVTSSVTNLPSGTYTVTVTDANGCTQSGLSNVSNANGPVISNVSAVNTSCFGGSNGSITVTVSGGTAPLTYQWSNGSSTQNISNVGSGTYTLTVTDANGCNASISQNVGQPIQIQIVTGSSNATCGQSNGSVSATASGGTGTLSYLWNTGAVTSSVTNLPSGTYTVTVTDANGCTQSGLSNVSNANGPVISNVSAVNTSCFGGSNGSITVTVSGGTAPLTYQWSNGSSTQNISNVGSGTYTLTVTDANGCNASISQNVGQPIQIQIVTGSSNATCGQSNGSVSATASGGTGTLSYLWNTGAVTSSVTNLPSGTYTVTVTDANGCTQSGLSNVSNANGPVISNVSAVNTSCFGGSNGSITVTVSGGTAPLTYQWSNGSSTQNISNVGSGTYTLTVTDANGCNASISQNVGQPIQIQIVTGSSNATCGQSNGSVSATASGGTGTLSYLWNTGAVTSSVTNLPSGTYTVTVTDANGCTQSGLSNVSNANGPVISNVSAVNTSCFGGSNGSITVTVSGGTAPLTYQWSNGSSTQNISNVGSGTYTLTVTDANGCNASISQNVGQPIQIQIVTGSSNATCGQSNGSVSATASGGTGTLSYLWNTGAVTSSVTNLPSGTYTVTVTDANGCTQSGLSNVSNANGPVISNVSAVNTSCFGGSNGSITVTVSGGTAPLTYQWSNGSSTQNISNVGSGTYTLTVTDANGCNASISQNVGQPIQIQIVTGSSNATCGQSNGSVSATASGGTGTLSYLWNTGAVTSSVTNLPSGTYTVTVTDANGCTQSGLSNVSNANGPVISNVSAVNTSCFGGSNGSITVTVSGGTAPLTYQWSNGSSTQNISNVGSGTYTLTVTDANGCNASISQNVGQPIQIQIVTGSSNATCGQSNGSVSATASGGTGTLSYLWNTGAVTSSVTNLPSGTYTVTVTDANGCTQSGLSNVSNANGPVISITNVINVSCSIGNIGQINTSVIGGTLPYSFLWSNGETLQNISNLSAGTYTVTVTDANGCQSLADTIVTQSGNLTLSLSVTNASCGNLNGSINTTIIGGNLPFTYIWSNGVTLNTLVNLGVGNYTVTVTDNNGCTASASASISNTVAPSVSLAVLGNVNCFGDSTGLININVSGGIIFNYLWSDGKTTQDISNVVSGTYTVTVTNNFSCTTTASFTVSQPLSLSIQFSTTQPSCSLSNGQITASVSGGTINYQYNWSNGNTTNSISNLGAGTFILTVTDGLSCIIIDSVTFTNTSTLSASLDTISDVTCFGQNNGFVNITVVGTGTPFNYLWSNGQTIEDLSNVAANIYTVTITDIFNCTTSLLAVVNQPSQINIAVTANSALCGLNNGNAYVTVSGGTQPYNYLWSNGNTTDTISNLPATLYTITVTDANNCTAVNFAVITNTSALQINTDSVLSVSCNGSSDGSIYVTINNATPPLQYIWSNGNTTEDNIGLLPATYTLTVIDLNGCQAVQTFQVNEPLLLTVGFNATNPTCSDSNGVIIAIPAGGTAPFNYLWNNGSTNQSIGNNSAGTYTVTVTDSKNCISGNSIVLITTQKPIVSLDNIVAVNCNGFAQGSINITVTSGTPPYNYQWSNGVTVEDLSAIPAGLYTVIVTDAVGCLVAQVYNVTEPQLLNATLFISNPTCGNANGLLTANTTGGTPGYTYLWSNGLTTQTISGLPTGSYTLTVTDTLGCMQNVSAALVDFGTPLITLIGLTNISCNGGSNGIIDISVTSGGGFYTFLWSNGVTTEDLFNVTAGTYTVTVTDLSGCSSTDTYFTVEPTALQLIVNKENATCGVANGIASISVQGGIGPYLYLWSDGSTTDTISALSPGIYTVTVTDFSNCSSSTSVLVNNINAPIVTSNSLKSVSCKGLSDGKIDVNITGGVFPYFYLWNNGATTQDLFNIPAGIYTLTLTDANNCVTIFTHTITEPDSLIASFSSTFASCNLSNGSATVTVQGGTLPYTYAWSAGSQSQTQPGVTAGVYTVTVTDDKGCTLSNSVLVANPAAPQLINTAITHVNCYGAANGAISYDIFSGTPPFNFIWSNGETTQNIGGLLTGNFAVTVTDSANCTSIVNFIVNQSTQIQAISNSINANCGFSNGIAQIVSVSGGNPPYSFVWSDGSTNAAITNLFAGSYTASITDSVGCTISTIINVNNTDGPQISLIDSSNVTCFGGNNGSVTIAISGGSAPYQISWTGTAKDSVFVDDLTAGQHTATVTDAAGCLAFYTVTLSEGDSMIITANIPQLNVPYHTTCYGSSDGSITAQVTGGVLPLTYLWSTSVSTQSINNNPAGNYTVIVTDALGCTNSNSFVITSPPQIIATVAGNQLLCGLDSTSIVATLPLQGVGYWNVLSGVGTVNDVNSNATYITSVPVGVTVLQWIVSDGFCTDTALMSITVSEGITAIAGVDRFVCDNVINLAASQPQFGTGQWHVIAGTAILFDSLQENTEAFNLNVGPNVFQWKVVNGNCSDSSIVTITLKTAEECLDPIEIPSGITPNADGKNDVFFIKNLSDYPINNLEIYNRWGIKIYESANYQNNWSGQSEQGDLPDGTYFYILNVKSINKSYKGYIDLRH
jgi:gliding motility-associated-like protein